MSVGVSTQSTAAIPQGALSLGQTRMELHDYSTTSGDTTATATAKNLHRVDYAILVGAVTQTSAPTYSTNVATFTFTDPAATVKCQIILFGR